MLEVRHLAKRYKRIPAVNDISFTIGPGEILGCLGPNGAGKSTTVKVLIGLIEPTRGEIFFKGKDVRADWPAFLRVVGYVPEEPNLYTQLTGREYLQLVGRLGGLPRAVLEARMDRMLRLFSLWEDRHVLLASYSKGMRQKILLSGALLHDPELLILDEPFSGLDVNTALVLRALIRALAAEGKMIFYSSHVLEVVEKVCTSVMILRKGSAVAHDRVERLRDLLSQPSLEAVFTQLTQQEDPERTVGEILGAMRS
ncbi:MAG TPA: ABC transporter ATP-binding protein [Bryobacteraceae bacterium]|nr:ABC transporter ATP-binding protein [Bryobacteraceae bacterium]